MLNFHDFFNQSVYFDKKTEKDLILVPIDQKIRIRSLGIGCWIR